MKRQYALFCRWYRKIKSLTIIITGQGWLGSVQGAGHGNSETVLAKTITMESEIAEPQILKS